MDSWHTGRLVGLDLETTGTNVDEDRIVTAAVALCGGGEETETLDWLANPGVEIPEEASAVHGITTEQAITLGREPAEVVSEIVAVLAAEVARGRPICAFNARFDLTMLDREARRYGIVPLTERGYEVYVVDALVVDKWIDRFRKGSRKLDATCAFYRVTNDGEHDASSDAVAACRCAWAIVERGRVGWRKDYAEKAAIERKWEAVKHDLPALHAVQQNVARRQAEGLADYFAQRGEAKVVPGDWPVIPVGAPVG